MNRVFDKIPIISKYVPGKITVSFLLLVLSIVISAIFGTADRKVCVIAVAFSFLGDVILNYKIEDTTQTRLDFIYGGISFIVAHVFYCIAYSIKIYKRGYRLFNLGTIIAFILLIIITIVFLIKKNKDVSISFFEFGLLYLWLTGINYLTIFSYGFSSSPIGLLVIVGGFSFLMSDVIIGFERFAGLKSRLARELVWWLYPIGQILLIAMA